MGRGMVGCLKLKARSSYWVGPAFDGYSIVFDCHSIAIRFIQLAGSILKRLASRLCEKNSPFQKTNQIFPRIRSGMDKFSHLTRFGLIPVQRQLFSIRKLGVRHVKDGDKARCICSGQDDHRIYSAGQKVSFQFSSACSLASP
jgi:hypothetical protein